MKAGFWKQHEVIEQMGLWEGASANQVLDLWVERIIGKTFNELRLELIDSIVYPILSKFYYKTQPESSLKNLAHQCSMSVVQLRYYLADLYDYKIRSTTGFRTGSRMQGGVEDLQRIVKMGLIFAFFETELSDSEILIALGHSKNQATRNKAEVFRKIFDFGNFLLSMGIDPSLVEADRKLARMDPVTARLLFTGKYRPPRAWNAANKPYQDFWYALDRLISDDPNWDESLEKFFNFIIYSRKFI